MFRLRGALFNPAFYALLNPAFYALFNPALTCSIPRWKPRASPRSLTYSAIVCAMRSASSLSVECGICSLTSALNSSCSSASRRWKISNWMYPIACCRSLAWSSSRAQICESASMESRCSRAIPAAGGQCPHHRDQVKRFRAQFTRFSVGKCLAQLSTCGIAIDLANNQLSG